MKSVVIIPSRIGSTRLPNKPLVKLIDKPLVQWVYEGAKESKLADEVYVATDSEEIKNAVEFFGGKAIITSSDIKTGTDRIASAVMKLEKEYDIIINVQGDEPLVNGEMVDSLIQSLIDDNEVVMSTLKVKFKNEKDILNPNLVKIITDKNERAIYFSRSIIPFNRDNLDYQYYRHMGYYGYRKDFILKYSKMKQTSLEKMESLEQLRVIENGFKIKAVETKFDTVEINVPEDIKKFEEKWKEMNE